MGEAQAQQTHALSVRIAKKVDHPVAKWALALAIYAVAGVLLLILAAILKGAIAPR